VPESRKAHKPDSKLLGNVSGDELEYWMSIFGDSGAGASGNSAELRLSDLENWLREFEATGRDPAKKQK
jgi:hypothetical protein